MATVTPTAAPAATRLGPLFAGREFLWGALAVLLVLLVAIVGPWLAQDPAATTLDRRLLPPFSDGHWLGTDALGRDLWARIVTGLEWSIAVAVASTAIAALIGTVLALLAAERAGPVRTLVLQTVDAFLSFPGLVVAIAVIATVGHGYLPLVLTLGGLSWPVFARVIYAEASSLMQRDYVLAARLAGSSRTRILAGHVLPGVAPTLLVMLAFHLADMLVAESALSFLGLGAPLGEPSLGNMLAESRQYLYVAPWLMFVPACAIVLVVVSANLLGDGLTERLRGRARRAP
ncbi:MAG: ABC transporter permease [Steroidobacteraceae bacterium]|nr:ABC transporter permease [Steroidobacteraceae bacterium]